MEDKVFAIIEPDTLSFSDQIALFKSVDVDVGVGGAAMFNAACCKPRTKVVSIEGSVAFLDAHTNMFAS